MRLATAPVCTRSSTARPVSDVETPSVEASVWRLSSNGILMNSVVERYAAEQAESDETGALYFYAELGSPTAVTTTPETTVKVYDALAGEGLSEGQILRAIASLQKAGVIFRERTV